MQRKPERECRAAADYEPAKARFHIQEALKALFPQKGAAVKEGGKRKHTVQREVIAEAVCLVQVAEPEGSRRNREKHPDCTELPPEKSKERQYKRPEAECEHIPGRAALMPKIRQAAGHMIGNFLGIKDQPLKKDIEPEQH